MGQKRKMHRSGELDALYFDKLPQRAKELFFEFLSPTFPMDCFEKYNVMEVLSFEYAECQSPIEIIFALAFDLMTYSRKDIDRNINISSQVELNLKRKYRVDFLFDSQDVGKLDNKPFKLVIECDGHDSHSSKAQIKYDNERDADLKLAGYDVIHFSGTQIFKEPFKCVNTAIDYIMSKIR